MRGYTLVELVAVVLLLSLITGVAALSPLSAKSSPAGEVRQSLAAARDSAVRSRQTVIWRNDGTSIRFDPTGSASGGAVRADGETLMVDPLTGQVHAR